MLIPLVKIDFDVKKPYYQWLGPVYYKTADCAVFVFDLTNTESLQYVEEKYGEFLLYRNLSRDNPSFPIVLIGNLKEKRA